MNLADFCELYELSNCGSTCDPRAQLELIWLLDHFRAYPETVGRLKLRLVDLDMREPDKPGNGNPPAVDVTENELATARLPGGHSDRPRRKPASICSAGT